MLWKHTLKRKIFPEELNAKRDEKQMDKITLGKREEERDVTIQYHRTQPQEDF